MPIKDKEDRKKWQEAYYKEHREELNEHRKQYYKDNKEKARQCNKNYRRTPRGRFIVYKKNAKVRGLIFEMTRNEFVNLVNMPCYYCGGESYGIDRLDNTMGYLKDNTVSCCSMCNYMKKSYSEGEFINQCIKISDKWKYYKRK